MTNNPQAFADEMMKRATAEAVAIESQREEVLRAFIAKYGFQPDNVVQVESFENGARSWKAVYIGDADVEKIRRTLLIARISKERLSLWQKICVWLAGGKWAK